MKLIDMFEDKNEKYTNISLGNVTKLTSQDISLAKLLFDLAMKTQLLLSMTLAETTVKNS